MRALRAVDAGEPTLVCRRSYAVSGRRVRAASLAVLCAAWATLAACAPSPAADREVVEVFAASSLRDALPPIAQAFEAAHPGVSVRLTFAGSQALRLQIERGAPAHVFLSANPDHAAAFGAPVPFAGNRLAVVVPSANPADIDGYDTLDRAARLVVGSPDVPLGSYTHAALERCRSVRGDTFVDALLASVVSREANARLVRAKVELGAADAAIVYRSDAVGRAGLRAFDLPEACDAVATYEAVVVSDASPAAAEALVAYLRSETAAAILRDAGFEPRRAARVP